MQSRFNLLLALYLLFVDFLLAKRFFFTVKNGAETRVSITRPVLFILLSYALQHQNGLTVYFYARKFQYRFQSWNFTHFQIATKSNQKIYATTQLGLRLTIFGIYVHCCDVIKSHILGNISQY
jgi:hypothetical protein